MKRARLSRLGVEEYEGDGLTRTRVLEARKMRGTGHSDYLSFFEIAGGGDQDTPIFLFEHESRVL